MLPSAIPIHPIPHSLSASVRVPGSKSLTNRALLVAALADGTTRLTNALFSDDSRYFVESLRRLGFAVLLEPDSGQECNSPSRCSVPSMIVTGLGGRIPAKHADLYIGNAGTAARFLTAMSTLGYGDYTIDGDSRMRQRPMRDLLDALEQLGAVITNPEARGQSFEAGDKSIHLPICVQARGLPGGQADIAGDASSQFLSGLLMVAPYAQHPVQLRLERGLASKPFVDMTLAVMADFGVHVEREGFERYIVSSQTYRSPGVYAIECDATAASYFFIAPAICGGTVRVEGIARRSKQGDVAFLDILAQMGCTIVEGPNWVSVTGSQGGSTPFSLHGVTVDMGDIPDTAQTLAAVAPFASTPTTIRGIASARLKETDRVAALCAELSRLGVGVEEYPDGLTIYPCHDFHPADIQTYNDHRMAMAFSMIGLKVPGVTISDPGCVTKTFPDFYKVLAQLQI
jgi:3-phosphoshikimate 1-carboxyvinyltransferase